MSAATSYVPQLGYFSSKGRFVPLSPGSSDAQLRLDVVGLARVTDALTLSLQIPIIINTRAFGSLAANGGGLGDVGLSMRYDLLPFDHSGRLGLAVVGGVWLPTGVSTGLTRSPLAVDATGRGVAAATAGLSSELAFAPWFLRCDLVATVPLPTWDGTGVSWLSPTLDLTLMGGARATSVLFLGVLARVGAQLPTAIQASGHDVGVGGSAAIRLHPQSSILAGVMTSIPVSGGGVNRNAWLSATLGFRHAAW